jgi:hypothetical protein
MNITGFIGPVFNFTGFNIIDRFFDIKSNGSAFRVGHHAAWPKHFAEFTYRAHHVRGGNSYIEIEPAFLNLSNQFVSADKIGTGCFSFLNFLAFGKNGNPNRLPVPCGKTTLSREPVGRHASG